MLAVVIAVVATLHARRRHDQRDRLNDAFTALADDRVEEAEASFQRVMGGLDPDPLGVLGLAITHGIHAAGQTAKTAQNRPFRAPAPIDEGIAVAAARQLLIRKQPDEALEYLSQAVDTLGQRRSLVHLRLFAASWVGARARATTSR